MAQDHLPRQILHNPDFPSKALATRALIREARDLVSRPEPKITLHSHDSPFCEPKTTLHKHGYPSEDLTDYRVQNALFMSIIAAGGPINWKNVVLPPGRSQMACWHVVDQANKAAAKAPNRENGGGGEAPATPAKKTSRAKKAVGGEGEAGGTPNKRKRGKKAVEEEVSRDGNDGEESDDGVVLKKAKVNESEEAEDGVKKEDSEDS